MSKERLREAIEALSTCMAYDPDQTGLKDSIDIVLAAARAYACERCGGTDTFWNEQKEHYDDPCPDCAEWRRIAEGGDDR